MLRVALHYLVAMGERLLQVVGKVGKFRSLSDSAGVHLRSTVVQQPVGFHVTRAAPGSLHGLLRRIAYERVFVGGAFHRERSVVGNAIASGSALRTSTPFLLLRSDPSFRSFPQVSALDLTQCTGTLFFRR